jgi:hypothetical protein
MNKVLPQLTSTCSSLPSSFVGIQTYGRTVYGPNGLATEDDAQRVDYLRAAVDCVASERTLAWPSGAGAQPLGQLRDPIGVVVGVVAEVGP